MRLGLFTRRLSGLLAAHPRPPAGGTCCVLMEEARSGIARDRELLSWRAFGAESEPDGCGARPNKGAATETKP